MSTYTGTLPTALATAFLAEHFSEVLGALHAIVDARSTYTPAWSSSGTAPALGNGTSTGYYLLAGKLLITGGLLVFGSTSTYGTGTWRVSLPSGITSFRNYQPGSLYMVDSGTAQKSGTVNAHTDGDKLELIGASAAVNATSPHTWANGDYLSWGAVLEAS